MSSHYSHSRIEIYSKYLSRRVFCQNVLILFFPVIIFLIRSETLQESESTFMSLQDDLDYSHYRTITVFSNIFSRRDLKKVFCTTVLLSRTPSVKKKKKKKSRNSVLKSCSCIIKSLSHEKSSVRECIYMHLNQKEEVHGCVLFFQTVKSMFYTCGSESNSHIN